MKLKRAISVTLALTLLLINSQTVFNKSDTKYESSTENVKQCVNYSKAKENSFEKESIVKDSVDKDEEYYINDIDDIEYLKKYKEYNREVCGLIRIEGTKLEHPVMRCETDEDFYLFHDLDRNVNSYGVPFIGQNDSLDRMKGNTVMYGHRMNDGDVFGELYKYESVDYFKEHPLIETVTDKGVCKWLIIAYFVTCNLDENAFDYFSKNDFISLEEFNGYMNEVEARNMLSVPMEVSIEDSFLTLSSCSREQNGLSGSRMVLVAVRIMKNFDMSETVRNSTQRAVQ